MFWCEVVPEVPMLLLKAGAGDYMKVADDHVPEGQRTDNSPRAILRRAAQIGRVQP